MDALDVLKSDHDQVNSLYEQFKACGDDRKQQEAIFINIRDELLAHCRLEETIFYPAFKHYPEFQTLLSDSFEDHRAVKGLLKRIDLGGDAALGLREEVDEVMQIVQEHVQKEEEELFSLVRKVMKRSERENLGRHLLAGKQEVRPAA